MGFKDYYEILGLQSSRVSDLQIKNAYREYVKKYHPDLNSGNKSSEERFKDISEAYKVLSNPNSKRKYDRTWIRNKAKEGSSYERDNEYPDTFVNEKDIRTEITISILEAFKGVHKRIALKDINNQTNTYTVSIPAGIQNGERIKLSHLGKNGKNGGKKGDLIIKVNIKDSTRFFLKGTDIKSYLDITPWEAALSSNITFESIDGNIGIYVPAGTQSGECISVPGKGYMQENGMRGNLILETRIKVPKKLSEGEKKLFNDLKEQSKFNPRKK